ncbi:hypothetical protein EG329_001130 [Mollisiaceae sp. DMI_Dod_QoI]|nr:hypothetical protein EG329_001130 [Helotiales sp. DMI_Dod_QoI]
MTRDDILTSMRGDISRTLMAPGPKDRAGAYSMQKTMDQSASADPETPVAKSKGGRKPIYTSLEQKKQRNRDSQAAFRERRREYITELEKIVQEQKEKLQTSEAAQISSKDECLMLKYKNSLLERILLEKGIDVNAELNRTLEFPPRLPAKRHNDGSSMKRKHKVQCPVVDVTPADPTSPVTTSTTHSASSPPEILCLPSDQSQTQIQALENGRKMFDFDCDFHFDPLASYPSILDSRTGTGTGFDMDLEFLSTLQT